MSALDRLSVEARCCVIGGGPAGAILSLLLARAGVPVTLLEAHRDFRRDFRGDTVHPSTLEVLDQIGLAGKLHELPHVKAHSFSMRSSDGTRIMTVVFKRLPTRFPYVMMMPQEQFIEFVVEEARRYSHFRMMMGARVDALLQEGGAVCGVHYRGLENEGEVRALLTVAADGRFSRVRELAGFEAVPQSGAMEVLWLRLPRREEDQPGEAGLTFGSRAVAAVLARTKEWQVGLVLPKGGYQRLKAEGIHALHESIASLLPWLADRLQLVTDWKQVNLLSVAGSRLKRWSRPGLIAIGDAAHVMLPVGGVGINCAIADAVEATNVLAGPLRAGVVHEHQLLEVQRRRERVTRIIQRFQAAGQRSMSAAIEAGRTPRPPLPARLMARVPGLRNIPARVMAFGVRRAELERPEEWTSTPLGSQPQINTAETEV
jgi:2-polyprenyl-6-methoxyphenol hydroxylase-like FAD-dependent oxidoreductase